MTLSMSQRTEATVVSSFALLSALALAFVVLRTVRLIAELSFKHECATSWTPDILFFRTRLGHYAACLILSNIFLTIARLIDLAWLSRSGLSPGSMCTAQAVLMQIGTWSVSWFTASHGVHTLCSLVFNIPQARWRTTANITVGWASALVVALAPLRQGGDVYGPVGASCTITMSHPVETFALQLFPILFSAIVSITVYSIVFVILHVKLSVRSTRKPRRSKPTKQDRLEEYHQIVVKIIRTMFWFPLAFILLFFPFCITHLLIVAGHSVPSAPCVFADVCISMLGFINVCLLCNTFRVIRHVYNGSCGGKGDADSVETFGNTNAASCDPLVVPPRTYHYRKTCFNQVSCCTIDLHSELLKAEKGMQSSTWNKPLPPLPPAHLSRRNIPSVILPLNIKKKSIQFQSGMTVASLKCNATTDPYLSRIPFVTEHKPSTRDEDSMADSDFSEKQSTKKLGFKSKAPPALNISRASVAQSFLSRQISSKSATIAARLGISGSVYGSLPIQTAHSAQNKDKGIARASSCQCADVSQCRPSSALSPTSTTLSADSDSDYDSVEIMHVRKIRPLPPVPESICDKDNTDAIHIAGPREPDARSDNMTVATVWSQESGETLNRPLAVENQGKSRRPVVTSMSGSKKDSRRGAAMKSKEEALRTLPKPPSDLVLWRGRSL